MKRILILIHVLFCGYICPLLAEDTGAVRYQDSILKVADALPATLVRRHVMTRNTTRTVCRIGWMC